MNRILLIIIDEQTEPADLHPDEINQPPESASTPTSAPPEADTEVWDILKSKVLFILCFKKFVNWMQENQ